ncbi:MAG: hypothetical protein WBD40_06805 [Tepidisphaeraceae bacterium]
MLINLPYQLHRDEDGTLDLRPICTVVLLGRTTRVPFQVLIDSGATHPFFPASAAKDAGLDLTRAQPVLCRFVGPGAIGYLLKGVFIEIKRHRLRIDVIFLDDQLLSQFGMPLLGRRGVFAAFNEVSFTEKTDPMRVELRS